MRRAERSNILCFTLKCTAEVFLPGCNSVDLVWNAESEVHEKPRGELFWQSHNPDRHQVQQLALRHRFQAPFLHTRKNICFSVWILAPQITRSIVFFFFPPDVEGDPGMPRRLCVFTHVLFYFYDSLLLFSSASFVFPVCSFFFMH